MYIKSFCKTHFDFATPVSVYVLKIEQTQEFFPTKTINKQEHTYSLVLTFFQKERT